MPKRSIRNRYLVERKALSIDRCVDSSSKIQQRFLRTDLFRCAKNLVLYSAVHNEVATDAVASQALDEGKLLIYPRIKGDGLEFVTVQNLSDLLPGAFGILEPRGDTLVPIEKIDLIVVPGVVFDRVGHRLGYGRGFYDRALAACRADCLKVGFAYDSQVVESLPAADHDKTLTVLMTESRMLEFSAYGAFQP
jgi:5-formyltetrahydrofolate cyclo-ligase